jgi:glycosyltransferase involved in cell wall biosynthesis
LLIIPCYNEEFRLDLEAFHKFQNSAGLKKEVSFLFANDGSKDNTAQKIQHYITQNQLDKSWFVFNNPQNTGKANVISNAYNWSKSNTQGGYDWYGYWDADLATPLFEVQNMLTYQEIFFPTKEAIFGSRVLKLGSRIVRKPIRHYLGRIFATVIFLALKVGSYDSQCGAKLMTKNAAEKALKEPFISPWIFDVEIMLRLGENLIVEYPLTEWVDIPGSKIKILKECTRILKDIFKIREKYLRK